MIPHLEEHLASLALAGDQEFTDSESDQEDTVGWGPVEGGGPDAKVDTAHGILVILQASATLFLCLTRCLF